MSEFFAVIIAGGKGERFWPQSRLHRPKHLLPIVGDTPMLAQTISRIAPLVAAKNIFVITNTQQGDAVREVCASLPPENIVMEPVGRDTAAAVGLAALLVKRRNPDAVFAVLPADHVIKDEKAYQATLARAFSVAASGNYLVTIGIPPTEPATGFGYIQVGEKLDNKSFKVKRFVEKPALEVAEGYLASGDYLWNGGMFIWSVAAVEAALSASAPDLKKAIDAIAAEVSTGRAIQDVLGKVYSTLPKISVDYAIMEKATNVVVVPAEFDWDDVGSWPAIARHHTADADGNVVQGDAIVEQGSGNIVVSAKGHLTAVLGVDDLIIVHTADATLVCHKSKAQDIKVLLKRLETNALGQKLL
ncbi:MAG TPA: sugar phosphate nucleotidyltransferase [Opitutaceae bacterium]|nr:sugar phosphate nucleotidyltransferase [Opitutaceae bacterium]